METTAELAVTREVERILRVDHAGEYGAIHIYRAQRFIARRFYPDIVSEFDEMLAHEREHFRRFDEILSRRSIRHCYVLKLWALGGLLLGSFTALLGRNAIWVCTYSIESTVLHHLEWQLEFLDRHDREVFDAVQSIQADEEEHRDKGLKYGTSPDAHRCIFWVVRRATEFAIWLSTKL